MAVVAAAALMSGPWRVRAVPPDILLVSIDTLRADRLRSYGRAEARTPALDRLAARGVRFTRASTVTPLTLPAHVSLMTGRYPTAHGVRDNGGFYAAPELTTLAERVQAAGYRTGAFVASFVLDRRWGLDQGFDTYWDDFDLSGGGTAAMDDIQRPAAPVVDRAIAWLDAAGEGPTFTWVHLYDPHTPYAAPEPYRSWFPATTSGAYDAEVAYVDAQLERLFAALAARGRLDRTVIAVTGDHGESLGEHGEETHGFFVYESTMHVPLIVAGPRVSPAVDTAPARLIDVAPTLLRLAGLDPLDEADGHSLLPRDEPIAARIFAYGETFYPRFHYGWSELRAVTDGRFKYVLAPRPELYDLHADPGETRNLADSAPDAAGPLLAALREIRRAESAAARREPQPMDADVQTRLQALGYVGAGRIAATSGPLADPKDRLPLYLDLKAALLDKQMRRWPEATARLARVLAGDPAMVEGHVVLGSVRLEAGDPAGAAAAYRDALALDPEHRGAAFNLALAYLALGRVEGAEVGFERLMAVDPRDGKPRWQLADLWMQRGEHERARQLLEASLDLKIDRPAFLLKLAECLIELGRHGEAETHLTEVLTLRPRMPRAHYDLGLIHEARGEAAAAERAYAQELDVHPETWAAAYNLGRLLLAQGRSADAQPRFAEVVRVNPGFAGGHIHLAKCRLDAGDLHGALTAAQAGLSKRPAPRLEAFGRYVLADVYSRQGRTEAAEREAARARRLEKAA